MYETLAFPSILALTESAVPALPVPLHHDISCIRVRLVCIMDAWRCCRGMGYDSDLESKTAGFEQPTRQPDRSHVRFPLMLHNELTFERAPDIYLTRIYSYRAWLIQRHRSIIPSCYFRSCSPAKVQQFSRRYISRLTAYTRYRPSFSFPPSAIFPCPDFFVLNTGPRTHPAAPHRKPCIPTGLPTAFNSLGRPVPKDRPITCRIHRVFRCLHLRLLPRSWKLDVDTTDLGSHVRRLHTCFGPYCPDFFPFAV